jgi:hypothetical protein
MLLLWINAVVTAAASTVWLMAAGVWVRRAHPTIATLYAVAALGSLLVGAGMIRVLLGGDPTVSAVTARQWVWVAVGAPALAHFLTLLRERKRAQFADDILLDVEARADAHDTDGDTADEAHRGHN